MSSSQPLSYLEEADISGGQLVLKDQITNHTIMARGGALTVRRLRDGVAADLTFALDQDGAPAKVQTRVARDAVTGRVRFAVDFEQLSPAELVKIEPSLSLDGVDLRLAGRLMGDIDPEHGLSPITFELRAGNGVIERPDWLAGPLPINSVTIKGRLAANLSGAEVTESRIATKGATVETTAQIVWADRQITLRAKVGAQNVAASDLKLYWPLAAGQEVRDWVLANVTDGVVPNAEVTIALKPGDLDRYPFPEGAVRGQFAFKGLTVRYFETMPPLTGVDGSANFTARRMDFTLSGGRIGGNRVQNGSAVITGMGIKGRDTTQLVVKATINSPLDQALALLDHRPLGFASKLGVDPGNASGQARADLTLTLPLHRDLDASELNVWASAQLQGAGIRDLPGQLDLSDGDFTLKVDNRGADLSGQGAIDQIPLTIDWYEAFSEHAAVKRRLHVQGTFDVQALNRFGLNLPIPATGTSQIDATMTRVGQGREAKLAVDLGPLAIDLPALRWQKPKDAGRASHGLDRDGHRRPGPGRGLRAREHRPGGRRQPRAVARAGADRAAGRDPLSRRPQRRQPRGAASGGAGLPGRGAGADHRPRAPARDAPAGGRWHRRRRADPPEVTVVADHVLFGEVGLSDVDLDLERDAQGWRTGAMHGRLPKGGKVEMTLEPADDQRRLKLTSDDAGDLLQALDQTNRIEGGKLELNATIRRQVPELEAEGKFRVKEFTLLDAPVLARVLTVASLTGVGNLLGGQGIYFDRLDLPFTLRHRVLAIEKGRLSGSQLGLTMRGRVDLNSERVDLNGTIVPLYGLNWVIGKLPLVGPFLTGREGEGAFAVTYSVTGPASDPEVSVNPLAVLAPGFIRDLFSGRMNDSTEAVPAISPN